MGEDGSSSTVAGVSIKVRRSPCPVADALCRTRELRLTITGASVDPSNVAVIEVRPFEMMPFVPGYGAQGGLRVPMILELAADVPVADHPTRLRVRLARARCMGSGGQKQIVQQMLEVVATWPRTRIVALERDTNPNAPPSQPNDLRAPEVVWKATTGGPIPKRQTLQGWKTLIFDNYMATEQVLAAVKRFNEGTARHSERVEFWINHKLNEPGYPFTDYPAEASSDAWTAAPSIRFATIDPPPLSASDWTGAARKHHGGKRC